jgi:hypothetical protein
VAGLAEGTGRIVRSSVFACGAIILSCGAHVLGGGSAPSPSVVGVCWALVVAGSFLLAGRRRGPVAIATALVTTQVLIHQALTAPAANQACGAGGAVRHPLAGHDLGSCADLTGPVTTSAAMVVWHGVATLLLAGLLAFGERALWRLVELTFPARPQPGRPVPATRVSRWSVSEPVVLAPCPDVGGVGRRGPPGFTRS